MKAFIPIAELNPGHKPGSGGVPRGRIDWEGPGHPPVVEQGGLSDEQVEWLRQKLNTPYTVEAQSYDPSDELPTTLHPTESVLAFRWTLANLVGGGLTTVWDEITGLPEE